MLSPYHNRFIAFHLLICVFHSQEALLAGGSIPYNVDNLDSASIRSSNRSPVSANETFWIPASHRKSIGLGLDGAATTSAGKLANFYLFSQ